MGDQYVKRLMQGKCTCGSMENYLNIPLDHGVRFGADEQPILNANDHVSGQHVIHFGRCSSRTNPDNYKLGIFMPIHCKCKPMTFLPWINGNEENILEGAPALTTKSKLPCFFGGVISVVEEAPPAPAEEAAEEPEEAPAEAAPAEPIVQSKSISQFGSINR